MHIDSGHIINDFIEPNKRQYTIPVYQRNYEWSREDCIKLFQDIVQAYKRDRNHYCGSIVYAPLKEEHNFHYYVIVDGQQRLTTIYLLIKALIDCADTQNQKDALEEDLFNKDKFDTYKVDVASKLKLKPIKSDNQQLFLLMDNKQDQMDKSSGIWKNYSIFKEQIEKSLAEDSSLDVKNIYKGIEKLTCACIKLDEDDNAQEIFERINSTGVPLSLADKIRNYVLMTDVNQDELYETYWLKMEDLVQREQMSEFFLDYLNLKVDSFVTEKNAYDAFKEVFTREQFTHESMLKELVHYADEYHTFVYGNAELPEDINKSLCGLHDLKQTTCYLFLFRVFDDYNDKILSSEELAKVLELLLSYSIRRIIGNIPSNSLRGVYKFLYRRVFYIPENKNHYYDSIVSFMQQMTSRDVIPSNEDFSKFLQNNDLYGKKALCRYLLISVENRGKEKVETPQLSIEHIMPQNKNLSTAWRKMLGPDWINVHETWLNTLGNLTLTGYNSELGDRPFKEKIDMIQKNSTKITDLNSDVVDKEEWTEKEITSRAKRLADIIVEMYPINKPETEISFYDPRYQEYTCEDINDARFKSVRYYELLNERVSVSSYAEMVRSVAHKLYDLDNTIIEKMARTNEKFPGWINVAFSYDPEKVKGATKTKIQDTEIYIATGWSAPDCILFIRNLLMKYDLDIGNDFVYSARLPEKSESAATI